MALIVLTSASGSPGVTTTALGLALAWPRPVVIVDADPTGSRAIAAGYLRGGELPTTRTVVDLAVSLRAGTLTADLPQTVFDVPGSRVKVLAGPLNHLQAQALGPLWEPLAAEFKALDRGGQDVIVDIGRLGLEASPTPLLTAADLAVLVTRSSLPALVGASSWAPTVRDWFERSGAGASLAALVVGAGRPYGDRDTAKVLGIPVAASLAWDPASAAVYSEGSAAGRKFQTAPLTRSLRAAVHALGSTLGVAKAELGLAVDGSLS